MSYAEAITAAVKARVLSLTLLDPGGEPIPPGNVAVRMLPQQDEALTTEQLPGVFIAPADIEGWGVSSFERTVGKVYPFEVAVILPGSRDFEAQLAGAQTRREQLLRVFGENKMEGLPSVWNIQLSNKPLFDRKLLNRSYVYESVTVKVYSNEPQV